MCCKVELREEEGFEVVCVWADGNGKRREGPKEGMDIRLRLKIDLLLEGCFILMVCRCSLAASISLGFNR